MKTYTSLLISLALSHVLVGQADFNPNASIILASDNFEQFTDAAIKEVEEDASTLFIGFGSPGETSDILICKLDQSGGIDWTKNYDSGGSEFGQRIVFTIDGGFALTGWTTINGTDDLLVVKCDEVGVVEWTQTIGGSGVERGRGINETPEGDLIVTGHTNTSTLGFNDILVAKLNSEGEVLWRNRYGGADNENGWDVETLSDGSHVITGNTASIGPGTLNLALMKIESDGTLIWIRGYGGPAGVTSATGSDIDENDNIYVAGYTEAAGGGGRDAYAARFDSEGILLKDLTVGEDGFDSAHDISYFNYNDEPNFIIAGKSNSYNIPGDENLKPMTTISFTSNFFVEEVVLPGEDLLVGELFGVDVAYSTDSPSILAAGLVGGSSTIDAYFYRGMANFGFGCVNAFSALISSPMFSFEEGGDSEADETTITQPVFSVADLELERVEDCVEATETTIDSEGYPLKLVPNPSIDKFIIEGCENSNYAVINMQGKMVEKGRYTGQAIEVDEWNEGIYLIYTEGCGLGRLMVGGK